MAKPTEGSARVCPLHNLSVHNFRKDADVILSANESIADIQPIEDSSPFGHKQTFKSSSVSSVISQRRTLTNLILIF